MRWIVDTSAWSRLHRPEVREQLDALLGGAESEDELVLSPAIELELLREPRGDAVAERRQELEEAMEVLAADAETFSLAADAMQQLALHQAEAHRRPIPNLITAALAHQHECGIVHLDGDFDVIGEHTTFDLKLSRIELNDDDGEGDGDGDGGGAHPATRQRQLKTELAQLMHQLPIDEAEQFLADVVERAKKRVGP